VFVAPLHHTNGVRHFQTEKQSILVFVDTRITLFTKIMHVCFVISRVTSSVRIGALQGALSLVFGHVGCYGQSHH